MLLDIFFLCTEPIAVDYPIFLKERYFLINTCVCGRTTVKGQSKSKEIIL